MHVLDLVLMGEDDVIKESGKALSAWYWHVKRVPFLHSDFEELKELTATLLDRLQPFASFGCSLRFPKLHCSTKLQRIIQMFGPYQHVTTDSFERSHIAIKAVFLRCVPMYILSPIMLIACTLAMHVHVFDLASL
ncbi:MAG: hypothetical protein JW384_00220 [Nitrosomonadaceae bacterium]|nr:hypothetical protein [Nitrosomonadaceae bacterium]